MNTHLSMQELVDGLPDIQASPKEEGKLEMIVRRPEVEKREVIEHGKTGYLIKPNDSNALANHIQQLADDRSLLTQLSLNARARYIQQPSWAETAGNIRTFLQNLI